MRPFTRVAPIRNHRHGISRSNTADGGTWRRRGRSWKFVAFATLGALVLFAQTGGRAEAPGEALGLPFFTSFSVTGGYKVAGVDLLPGNAVNTPEGSFVTGTIHMTDVPTNAVIVAAYLYWETITNGDVADGSVGAKFRGQTITVEHAVSKSSAQLGQTFAPCWTSGGGSSANYILTTYRADVLQLLPSEFDANGISTGRRLANGDHTVTLPEAGNGNQPPQSAGASLFVVYRSPNVNAALTRVVVYDGLSVQTQGTPFLHTIRGFFDAANSNPVISMTHIVGSGADNNNDRVTFNGTAVPPNGQTSVLNPFKRTSGGTSDRGWSNPTFENLGQYFQGGNSPNAPQNTQFDSTYGEWVTTGVNHGGQDSPNDCLTWAAIILSATGQDTDGDGLLDKEETADNGVDGDRYGFKDPNDVKLPPLKRMGASSTKRDMFIEIAAMKANAGTTYGSLDAPLNTTAIDCGTGTTIPNSPTVTSCQAHNHMPSPVALAMLGQQFAAAPADPRYSSAGSGITLHIDVGDPAAYRALFTDNPHAADAYLVGNGSGDNVSTFATGGESVLEGPCDGPCPFPAYPGTVTWKTGFGLYKEHILDPGRERYFRFGFYAHAKGTHKSPFACLDAMGNPTVPVDGQCAVQPNPQFYVPRGISGSGDFPGADFLITLGFFDNTTFVGSDFVVASTTMHEMGHTLGLGHGGPPLPDGTLLPNCKPNYVSVMNYDYQLGGGVDRFGAAHLVFSSGGNDDLSEAGLTDQYAADPPYRLSWFAPKPANDTRKVLKRFCTGASFDPDHHPGDWIRVDGDFFPNGNPKVDWDADGVLDLSGVQDVNFDGIPASYENPPIPVGALLTDRSDWTNLRLNQVGDAGSIFGFSAGSTLRWDGTTITSDGITEGSGTTITADGTTITGDGTTITSDGATITSDGTLITSDGVTITSDGTTITSDGVTVTVHASDGTLITSDGTTITSDGTTITSDGTTITSDGTLITADGVTITSDGVLITSDGVRTSDDSALSSNHNEVSPKVSAESGNLPGPQTLTVCVIGTTGCADPNPAPVPGVVILHRHRLDFAKPTVTVAPIVSYTGYRVVPGGVDKNIGTTPSASQMWLVDTEELPNGVEFTYYVVANLADLNVTGRSNYARQVARNDPPSAAPAGTDVIANAYTMNPNSTLNIAAPGVLGNDKAGADSYPTALKAVPLTNATTSNGGKVTLNADGSFTFTPKARTSSDSFTYQVNNGAWSGNASIPLNTVNSGSVTVTITITGATK